MSHNRTPDERQLVELVRRAEIGDEQAWAELVCRYAARIDAVARAHRLSQADIADVAQNTWLTMAEHLGSLRDPARFPAFLSTIARRESLRVLACRRREPVSTADWPALGDSRDGPERLAELADRDRALWTAVATLPPRCRRLLLAAAYTPEVTNAQLGQELGIAVTSVGRTRSRCLVVLRRRFAMLGGYRQA
jgi:RNA polymerase sigma factor (sigma-70 family)